MQQESDLLLYCIFVLSVLQMNCARDLCKLKLPSVVRKKSYVGTNYVTSGILQMEYPGDPLGQPFFLTNQRR